MRYKNIITIASLAVILGACGNNKADEKKAEEVNKQAVEVETKDDNKQKDDSSDKNAEESVIYASFFPIYDLTKQIAGDKYEVKSFTNLKTEIHAWEPSAKEIAELSDSNLMFINGAGLEEWEDNVKNASNIDMVDTTKDITLIEANGKEDHDHEHEDHEHEDHDHEHEDHNQDEHTDKVEGIDDTAKESEEQEHDHEHNHGKYDPHTWLSPENGKLQAKVIADKLSEVDPNNKDYYEENYNKIKDELDEIINEYKEKFSKVSNNKFIVPHQAFGYLAKEFNLEQIPLASLTSTDDPDAKVMKEVTDLAKASKIKTVFFEKGGSDKAAQTIAEEIGAKAEPINTLEFATEDELNNDTHYQQMIRENLEAIYNSMS